MTTKVKSGKGATKAQIGQSSFRPRFKQEGLTISDILTPGAQIDPFAKPTPVEKTTKLSETTRGNRLQRDRSIFDDKLGDIESLMGSTYLAASKLGERTIEIEARFFSGSNAASNSNSFERIRRWLESRFTTVTKKEFQEKQYVINDGTVDSSHRADYIWRGNTDRYVKIKSIFPPHLDLPSIQNLIVVLGISVESPMQKSNVGQTPDKESKRTRWSFPINGNTAKELGIDPTFYGGRIDSATDTRDKSMIRGTIDLDIREEVGEDAIYSIEIELDHSTIGKRRVKEHNPFTKADTEVEYFTLTEDQLSFLDSWIKILATVINRSGILLTTEERDSTIRSLNGIFGINSYYITTALVNRPKDLEKRDMAWLNPEESEIFMALGDYDKSAEVNRKDLKRQGIFQPLFGIHGGFYVSMKADGTRYWLYTTEDGIYLINLLGNIITKIAGRRTRFDRFFNLLPGTVLDVEVIGNFRPDGTLDQYKILVFDAVAISGKDIRKLSYTDRLINVENVVEYFNDRQKIEEDIQKNLNETRPALPSGVIPLIPSVSGDISGLSNYDLFDNLIKIQTKPVWKLPSKSDIAPGQGKSKIDVHFANRSLALKFFSLIGSAAEKSMRSNSGGWYDSDSIKQDPIPQITENIEWLTDGIILTPAETPYLDNSDLYDQNISEKDEIEKEENVQQSVRGQKFRSLIDVEDEDTNYSLVRKWKPYLTIDFRVKPLEYGGLSLFTYSEHHKKEIPFQNNRYRWNGNAELSENMIGKVVEFEWRYSDIIQDYAFVPVRIRDDKPNPNSLPVVNATWILINDPITIDDLYGKNLTGMRKYHNRVKTALLKELVKLNPNPVLLDLGSGKGGDISKWTGFDSVYAVEPDVENIREFLSRKTGKPNVDYSELGNSKDEDPQDYYSNMALFHRRSHARREDVGSRQVKVVVGKVEKPSLFTREQSSRKQPSIKIINAGAEDLITLQDAIPVGVVNAVTIFNALTFFYDKRAHLDELIRTISHFLKPGGYCYMIAFDGELLLNSMKKTPREENADGEILTHDRINTGNVMISKIEDDSCRKIWIKIEGAIVRGQYEYLINTTELVTIMRNSGYSLIEERYLNEETLLSQEEYWFSSMFKVLKFRYFSSQNKKDLKDFLVSFKEKMLGNTGIQPLLPEDPPQEIQSLQLARMQIVRLLRYGSPQDGSCYIHSCLRSFSFTYSGLTMAEKTTAMIQLRKELAENYTREIHENTGNKFFSTSQYPEYSYENVKDSIKNVTFWVSNHLMPFIGDQLNVNVYILRGNNAELYRFGSIASLIVPGRRNIVLYWINDNHYETVGLLEGNNTVRFVFDDNHPLIAAFKKLDKVPAPK